MTELPSQEYLRSRIDYNPETGEARWKPVDQSYGYNWQRFNAQSANKILPDRPSIRGTTLSKAKLLYKLYYGTDIRCIRYVNKDSTDYRISNLKPVDDILSKIKGKNNVSNTRIYKSINTNCYSLLRYDHTEGNLIWNPRGDKSWDTRFSNKKVGSVFKSGYLEFSVKIDGATHYYMGHRVAWMLYYQVDPVHYQIDHIDGNKTNNSIRNLRLANGSLNVQTRKSITKHFIFRENTGKFYCNMTYNGSNIYLGDFYTEAEAQQVYESALEKYKPIYQFTESEQTMLDELYAKYPNVTRELQHACHALQVKALNHYTHAIENEN